MNKEEFARSIGININGSYNETKDSYIIDLLDSDEYALYFSKLEKSDKLKQLEDNSLLTEHDASALFTNEDFIVSLLGDFNNDKYSIIITDIPKEEEIEETTINIEN